MFLSEETLMSLSKATMMETSILEHRPVLPVIQVSSIRATQVSESFKAQTRHWPGAGSKLGATKFGTRYRTRRNAPGFREVERDDHL